MQRDPLLATLRVVAPILAIGFLVLVVAGLRAGSFGDEGGQIVALEWGRITLIDTYLAFALPVLWMWLRDPAPRALGLTLGVVLLGSVVLWGYVAVLAWRVTDRRELLLGRWDIHPPAGPAGESASQR
jgi:hypothetical protein